MILSEKKKCSEDINQTNVTKTLRRGTSVEQWEHNETEISIRKCFYHTTFWMSFTIHQAVHHQFSRDISQLPIRK